MKKGVIISIAILVVLAILGGVIIMLLSSKKPPEIGTFNLANYLWEIETFPLDKNVGKIDDVNTAIEKAKELWIEKFSMINGQPYNPINGRKIEVSYDSDNECWHINGTLPSNTLGGVPHALINKDGKVLAVWHDD